MGAVGLALPDNLELVAMTGRLLVVIIIIAGGTVTVLFVTARTLVRVARRWRR